MIQKQQINNKSSNFNYKDKVLIQKKYDPFYKGPDPNLIVEKDKLRFIDSETNQNQLQKMNPLKLNKTQQKLIQLNEEISNKIQQKKQLIEQKYENDYEQIEADKKKSVKIKKQEQEEILEQKKVDLEQFQHLENIINKYQQENQNDKQTNIIDNQYRKNAENNNQIQKYEQFLETVNNKLDMNVQNKQKQEQFQKDLKEILQKQTIVQDYKNCILKPEIPKNIFKDAEVMKNLKYVDESFNEVQEIGAKYDKKGQIIPRSIIGKPDWYINQQQRNQGIKLPQDQTISNQTSSKQQRPLSSCPLYSAKNFLTNKNYQQTQNERNLNKQQQNCILDNNNNDQQNVEKKIIPIKGTRKFIVNLNRPQTAGPKDLIQFSKTGQTTPQTQGPSEIQKNKQLRKQIKILDANDINQDYSDSDKEFSYILKTLDQNGINQEINNVKNRIEFNKLKNDIANKNILSHLHKGDQQYMTKEEKAMLNYQKEQERMKKFISYASKKIQRDEQKSIFVQSHNYRSKLETAQALEIIQPDYIKNGNRYWQMKLRDFKPEDEKFNLNDPDAVQLEVIRRPYSALIKSKLEGNPPFKTFTSPFIFQDKLKENIDKLNRIKHYDDREIELLEIHGENKLKKELKILENTKESDSIINTIYNNTNKSSISHRLSQNTQKQNFQTENITQKSYNNYLREDQQVKQKEKEKNTNTNINFKNTDPIKIDQTYQQFDNKDKNINKKKVYKLIKKKKIDQNEEQDYQIEQVIESNWQKERINHKGALTFKQYQMQI